MLDDMRVLRESLERYRVAANAVGFDLPTPESRNPHPPLDLVRRMTELEDIPEQLTWLHTLGWSGQWWFPCGVHLMDWPGEAQISEYLDYSALAVGAPFPWWQQLPLFFTDYAVLTFVLADGHEGEIWHYEWEDGNSTVRAAPSLAYLFDQWTKALEIGAVVNTGPGGWLQVDGEGNDEQLLEQLAAQGLDPVAFAQWMAGCSRLREWQTASGVDLDEIDRGYEAREALLNEAGAFAAELKD